MMNRRHGRAHVAAAFIRRGAIACAVLGGLGATTSFGPAEPDPTDGLDPPRASGARSGTIAIGMPGLANTVVAPSASFDGGLQIDLSEWAGEALSSLALQVQWNTDAVSYVEASQPAVGQLVLDESAVATGTLNLTWSDVNGVTDDLLLSTLGFTAGPDQGQTFISIQVNAASTATGDNVLSSVFVRTVPFCIAAGGVLGDVTGDGLANIIDAQQIARSAVGLSVSATVRENLDLGLGDATLDGSTNIIDAQQVARFGVGLSSSPGIGDPLPGGC